ncbi:hypothetical protein FZZ93_17355 [Halomonas eurihalina]|uniref:Uncharacterized protein n=1 Tax=Halomonas eurihalina TaxID=42566 RepID=A0A5D9CIC9_HALER|nr:hypothetical protein [Halomonas eurihalina]MDR5860444.1 hypothetical protein [Halomonas eurihalina]TZG31329.1 hypothetical protein FZZ93_17355 [Halomonas eurihalina]
MSGELEDSVILEYSFTGMHIAPTREPDTYRDDCSVKLTHDGVEKISSSVIRNNSVSILYEDVGKIVLSFNKVSPGYSCSVFSQHKEGGFIEFHSYNYVNGINQDPLECDSEYSEVVKLLHSKISGDASVRCLYEDKGVMVRQSLVGIFLFLVFLPVVVVSLILVTGSPFITAILGVVVIPAIFPFADRFMPEGKEYSPSCIPSQFLPSLEEKV